MDLSKLKQLLTPGRKDKEGADGPSEGAKEQILQYLKPVAKRLSLLFPNLKRDLVQAEMEEQDDVNYLATVLYKSLNFTVMLSLGLAAVAVIFNDMSLLSYLLLIFPLTLLFSFFTFAKQPAIKAKKRTRQLEKELPYALRHILVEVESGIPLYQAMVSITEGYGEASDEFQRIVNEINAGSSEIAALEESILRNPSRQFRRALWQLINALRSGADISDTLESLVDTMIDKQILAVEEYGQELNPYTLMYLLIAIIMPSLGVTFLMLISSFTGLSISNTIFYVLLIGLVLFQTAFINLVSSKRPQVKT